MTTPVPSEILADPIICDADGDALLLFDGQNGAFMGEFASGLEIESPVFARFGPSLSEVSVTNFSIGPGSLTGGGLEQLLESDNDRMSIRAGPVFPPTRSQLGSWSRPLRPQATTVGFFLM